jgi:hypothetical protein
LDVIVAPGAATFGGKPSDAVTFEFVNRTGSVVYLSGVQMIENPKNFPATGAQDISTGWRPLKFGTKGNPGMLTEHEFTLQTNANVISLIGASKPVDGFVSSYRPPRIRRWFRFPKFFKLQFTAVVAGKTYSVEVVR